MAEALVGALLSAIVQVAFDRLVSHDVMEFLRKKEFNHVLLKKLEIKLISINALLNDAEEKQITNPAVKQWLDKLEDAAFDADDLLDEIATDAMLNKLEAESGTGTRNTNSKGYVSGMENRMKMILELLEFIADQKDLLDLKVKGVLSPREPTTSLPDQSEVYVRDSDKEAVLKMLREEYKDVSNPYVKIAIVGMGGAGKTTLAQYLYDHREVKELFELRSWVYISERFDISAATKAVLTAVTDHPSLSSCDNKDLDWLQTKLQDVLKGRKVLLVLDDLWNGIWEHMSKPFTHVARGSKILITTRDEKVAERMGAIQPYHQLNMLEKEDCLKLFEKHAFGGDGNSSHLPQYFEKNDLGAKIFKKCGGLPLAAKTLGCLLRYKQNAEEWERILNNEILDFPYEDSKVRPVLMLSYLHLPLHLKRCFVFCSIFPKGYEFHKHQLLLLWMAANLLQKPKRSTMTMEELGDKYFEELSSRSFFQQSTGGEESRFVMNDLIHDLAQYVSRGHYFTLEDGNSEEVTLKVRHLVVASHVSHRTLDSILKATHLRTLSPSSSNSFHYLSNKAVNDIVSKLTLLRVLNLSGCENLKELPENIGDLKHLRSLDLSNTLVERLPESVSKLYNLQILNLSGCQKLTQLPADMHLLVNLRHLDIAGCDNIEEMPTQIGRLKSLQTLTTFILGEDGGAKIEELGELEELRGNLSLQNLENVANGKDASKAKLVNKKKLEELTFSWSGDTKNREHDKGVLEELLSGTELKRLNIIGYRGMEFPNCFCNPNTISNIVSIRLEGCKSCQSLPALGGLPSLKTLYIKQLDGIKSVSKKFYGTNGKFVSLESLSFSSMSAWREWNSTGVGVKDGEVFPRLRELSISDCNRLIAVDLPCNLPSLTKLLVSGRTKDVIIQSLIGRTLALRHLKLGEALERSGRRSETSVLPHSSLTHLASFNLRSFPDLTHLDLVKCENLEGIQVADGEPLPLGSLFIEDCPSFKSFSGDGLKVCNLNSLTVKDCETLEKLPDLPPSLKQLWIINCPKVESFPAKGLPSTLNGLLVDKCSKLTANRKKWNLQTLPALEFFDIRDESDATMESFPDTDLLPSSLTSLRIGPLASLKELDMMQLLQLTSLNSLDIDNCPKLTTVKVGTALRTVTLPKLRSLFIKDCENLTSFLEGGLNAPCLNYLTVQGCKKLTMFPGKMHDLLQSLERLWIIDCPEVQSFPTGGLPSTLNGLLVDKCSTLTANRMEWNLQTLPALECFDIRDNGPSANVESFS